MQVLKQHTPGPWDLFYTVRSGRAKKQLKKHRKYDLVRTSNMEAIMCMGKNAEANAKLIVQAPATLEALEYAEQEISALYEGAKDGEINLYISIGQWRRLEKMRETIVRARGES